MRLRERPTRSLTATTLLTTNTTTSTATSNNTSNDGESNSKNRNRSRVVIQRWMPFLIAGLFVVLILLGRRWRTASSIPGVLVLGTTTSNDTDTVVNNWCDRVTHARVDLNPDLAIHYPCETILNSQQSAAAAVAAVVLVVVCMLTGSFDLHRANKILFIAREYLDGALALGCTVHNNIDPSRTHICCWCSRKGVSSPPVVDRLRLRAVGWTLGDVQLLKKYVPTYANATPPSTRRSHRPGLGLSEYQCAHC
mmetsp:Transcript_53278/g.59575  ORF Transcript_53278/g.59575 Transcript_53278/m.59575 type:complete len:252 (-) Transcript_53278:377-1132(-)